jgi:hypothetical protein
VLRESVVRAAARVLRRAVFGCIVACVVVGGAAAGASADGRPTPNPQELWRAYPLEQTPKGGSGEPAPRRRAGRSSPMPEGAARGPALIGLASAAAGGALLVLMAVSMRHRRVLVPNGARPSAGDPAVASQAPRSSPSPSERPTPAKPTRRSNPARSRTRHAGSHASGRTAAVRNAPVCQIRWSPRSGCFYAVTAGADGLEQRVVRSSHLDWGEPSPPEPTREAQAALRQLAKELRDRDWRPLRAKGIDFDEQQWYARRFRRPEEAQAEKLRGGKPGAEVVGRSRGEQRRARARS